MSGMRKVARREKYKKDESYRLDQKWYPKMVYQTSETRGERVFTGMYDYFSKAKGEKVSKFKKGPVNERWKALIVDSALKRKEKHGAGNPTDIEQDEQNEDTDIIADRLADILHLSDSDDNYD